MNKENNNDYKNINTIIKDLSISPQKKLYIYLDSKPIIKENITNGQSYKYYLYDIKEMFLKSNNKDDTQGAHINKDYTPQQIRLNKELKNIFTDNFNTIQLIYDTTPKTF